RRWPVRATQTTQIIVNKVPLFVNPCFSKFFLGLTIRSFGGFAEQFTLAIAQACPQGGPVAKKSLCPHDRFALRQSHAC
ncbi:MAG: hypothetical protein ACIALR_10665, partial [Blastopirellula sp. JB062]